MSNIAFAWLVLSIYGAIIVWLAFRGFRRTTSMASFAVGNRDVSPIFVGLSLAAQLTSVATFVINPGLVYRYGLSALLGFGVAACLGITVGMTILSKGFRNLGERMEALTVPAWLGQRYSSRAVQICFACLSLGLISFMVLLVVGMSYILMNMLEIPAWTAALGIIVFVFTYVLLGGANTSMYTNSVQAMIMALVALILLGSGAHLFSDGIGAFFQRLASRGSELVGTVNPKSPYFRNLFEVFFCNFVVGLAIVTQPHVIGKSLSLKNNREVNRFLLTAIVVGLIFTMVLWVGFYARLTLPSMARIDLAIPTYIHTQFSGIFGVVISVGVLCAGISTLEGVILALSAIFAADLFFPMLKRRMKQSGFEAQGRVALKIARLMLALLGCGVFILCLFQIKNPTGGSVAIFAQYGVYGLFSATFIPILAGLIYRSLSAYAVLASTGAALMTYIGMAAFHITDLSNNPAVLSTYSIGASALVMGAFLGHRKLLLRSARQRVSKWSKQEL